MSQARRLVSIIESAEAALERRIDAAHELAALGDPRILRDRVLVPAGSFLMGDDAREVWLPGYAIDRFPVTVGAFAAFVDQGGYDDPGYWSQDGWSWRTTKAITSPRFWDEPEWKAYLLPNHPVVGTSFFEAEAYAAFAGARLPTEAEWEKAARGTDGRMYPWGPELRQGACGMRGVGPRSTLPIGVFPDNASPYGVRDMVGSVWQWCSDRFVGWGGAADEARTPPSKEPATLVRATRGGAWNTLALSVTCRSRNGYPSSARFSNLGFRCVVDAPSSIPVDAAFGSPPADPRP